MPTKSIVLRKGVAFATFESNLAVHLIRAASYEFIRVKEGLAISFELCPTGASARHEAAQVLIGFIRSISLNDLRIQKRLLDSLREISVEGRSWWVVVRFGDKEVRRRVVLVVSLINGIEMQIVGDKVTRDSN